MRVNATITLNDAYDMLRESIALQLRIAPSQVGDITITSYEKARIVFKADGLVESSEFRHRLTP